MWFVGVGVGWSKAMCGANCRVEPSYIIGHATLPSFIFFSGSMVGL